MNSLKASLVLTFRDELTAPLRKIKQGFGQLRSQLEDLRDVGRGLSLPGLNSVTQELRQATGTANRLARALHGIGGAAKGAWGHVRKLGGAVGAGARRVAHHASQIGAVGGLLGIAGVIEPLHSAGDYDATLRSVAILENMNGKAATQEVRRLRSWLNGLALHTGQSSSDLAQGLKQLDQYDIPQKIVELLLPSLAKAATAYHLNVADTTGVGFALNWGLGVGPAQMEAALAQVHKATQLGHFTMGLMAQQLAGVASMAHSWGIQGLSAVTSLTAMLETAVRNTSMGSEAATNINEFMNYLGHVQAQRGFDLKNKGMTKEQRARFARYHVKPLDLGGILATARRDGQNPIEAVMSAVRADLKGAPIDVAREALGSFFSNQQAMMFATAMLQNWGTYQANKVAIAGANPATLQANFETMFQSTSVQLKILNEHLRQLVRTIGTDFTPLLQPMIAGLKGLKKALDWLGPVGRWAVAVAGGIALLGGILGMLSAVAPGVGAGLLLVGDALGAVLTVGAGVAGALEGVIAAIGAPFAAVAIVIGAAALDIYEHWSKFRPFFHEMGHGVMLVLGGLGHFVAGVFTWNLREAVAGIGQVVKGIGSFFGAEIDIVKRLLLDLVHWLTGWTDKQLAAIAGRIGHTLAEPFERLAHAVGLDKLPAVQAGVAGGAPLRAAAPDAIGGFGLLQGPRSRPTHGHVTVGVDPHNGRLHITHASPPSVVRVGPDMGHMLGGE